MQQQQEEESVKDLRHRKDQIANDMCIAIATIHRCRMAIQKNKACIEENLNYLQEKQLAMEVIESRIKKAEGRTL